MSALLPLLMFILAGFLLGGVFSLHKQGGGRRGQLLLGFLAALALAGGIAWMWPS